MKTLQTRLLISYFVLILIILSGIIFGFIWSTIKYPIGFRQSSQQLNLASEWISSRLSVERDISTEMLERALTKEAANRRIRVVLFQSDGFIDYDSASGVLPDLELFLDASLAIDEISETKLYRGDKNHFWFYLVRRISEKQYMLLATPRQRISILSVFREQLASPMMIGGGLGIFAAVVLSFWLSSWMNQPLKNMASNAPVMLSDDSKVLNVEGPHEVQQLATTFNELIRQIKSVRHSQKVFLGNVSHDLKTPITSIQGYSRAMLDGTLQSSEEFRKGASIIFDEADRMQRMVEEMLLLTRLEAGSVPLNCELIALKPIILSVIEKLKPQVLEKQIELTYHLDSEFYCQADGDKMMQVFTNLLDNAIKYTPAGGKIRIDGKSSGYEHQIEFADTGIGISEADQRNIFDRFFQADLSRKSDDQHGVGLGLSIVSQLIRMHDGKISLKSTLGQGSTFTIILPASK
ncbi:MAG: HAMP domain-containing histidine kinase [Anaerolineaceae bacterium]|nr:HAMP domain-containing histidine kinase [Anaerolineaceae bacterium]